MKVLHADPTPLTGCYTLHLYCKYKTGEYEHDHCTPQGEVANEYGSTCRAIARRAGWTLHKNGLATCPRCNGYD